MGITVNDKISLVFLEEKNAASLLALVDGNRGYLREWLPWVDHMQQLENASNYISSCIRQATEKTDYGYAIMYEDKMVGRIGIHRINQQNKIGEIGYWLADGFQKKGIVTSACSALVHYGFTQLGLNRIEIKCATGNHKSRAIAEKLDFKREGILRQAEWLNGRFVDLYLYSLLREEWKGKKE